MLFLSKPPSNLSIVWAKVDSNATDKVIILMPVKLAPIVLTGATSGFALTGKTISAVTILGSLITLTVSVAYASGDVPLLSFTAPTVDVICDENGRKLANFSNYAVTNNIGNTSELAVTFASRTTAFEDVSAGLYRAASGAANGTAYALVNRKIPEGCSGYIAMDYSVSGSSVNQSSSLGFRSTFTNDPYLLVDFCGVTSTGTPNQLLRSLSSSTFTGAGYTLVVGDTRWRLRRDVTARTISIDTYTSGSWVTRYSGFPYYDGDLWPVCGVNVALKQLLNPVVVGTV